jgi:glycosyltransferase involved in cell wall biosynthesis
LGNLDHRALFRRYQEADLLVFPTVCDGFGMVVTEALANGLPVLTTTSAGAADMIRDGENGWVIPPSDEDALAAALTAAAANPARVRDMRAAAMSTAAARPWTVYRREFAQALHDLATRLK